MAITAIIAISEWDTLCFILDFYLILMALLLLPI